MSTSSSYITRAEFNKNVHNIYIRSIEIQDFSWRLIKVIERIVPETLQVSRTYVHIDSELAAIGDSDLVYLEKSTQAVNRTNQK